MSLAGSAAAGGVAERAGGGGSAGGGGGCGWAGGGGFAEGEDGAACGPSGSLSSSSPATAAPANPSRRKGITDIILAIFALTLFEVFAATAPGSSIAPLKLWPRITISFKFCTYHPLLARKL